MKKFKKKSTLVINIHFKKIESLLYGVYKIIFFYYNSVAEEERKVRIIEEDVSIKTKLCEEDLRKAEPALIAAQEALNTLNKNNLTELKSFGTPPQAVINVCAAVLILFSTRKLPKDRSWKACKVCYYYIEIIKLYL